ncbi:MAG: hypothetical protein M0R47_12815 [Methylobacter sp.]|uniref:hypothetical protein n=1 Tax=Methylobacter sp. TaxID=2051955 RepID=UPI0025E0CEB8|nr:hypothetical protein [Methylobacter sp.]MCK9621402.1 hypothetical protein [Methylobacter sp.]
MTVRWGWPGTTRVNFRVGCHPLGRCDFASRLVDFLHGFLDWRGFGGSRRGHRAVTTMSVVVCSGDAVRRKDCGDEGDEDGGKQTFHGFSPRV